MAAKTLLYTAADETLAPINTYSGENKATKLVVNFSNCGVDTYVKWVRFSNSEPIPLGTAISVEYEIPVAFMARGRLEVQPYAISGTGEVVKFAIRAIPVNRSLEEVDDNAYDPTELEAIQLSFSEIWDAYESGNLGGASAYQVAVNNGFIGTEAEWLLSLKGADGADGVDGINGTDGIDGIDGTNGLDGEDGADGLSAYQVAVNNGFVGTEAEWLLSLVGATGADGQDGSNFTILGQYATLGALQTAHPTGSAGDAWAVGDAESSDLYIWDTVTNSWKDIGQVGINMTADSITVEDLDENYAGITVEEILAELPSKFSEMTHVHTISEVTGLDTALAGKASSTHSHEMSDVVGLVDSLNNIDGYIGALQTEVNGKSTYTVYTATIPSASWTGSSAPFSKVVTVSGILATDVQPSVNTVMTGTYATDIAMQENLAKIYRIVNTDNTLTCYANSIPTADIPIQIVVVR